jgi:hypothetical protein
MGYRKNKYRQDIVNRFGPEVGLPLFSPPYKGGDERGGRKPVPSRIEARLNAAPKAITIATDTRKLGEMTAKADALKLAGKQQKIYDTMYLRDDWTNTEIAEKLGWAINRIVGRVFELRQMGLVVESCKRICDVTGMVVTAWRVK